jgi:hypothetical protein
MGSVTMRTDWTGCSLSSKLLTLWWNRLFLLKDIQMHSTPHLVIIHTHTNVHIDIPVLKWEVKNTHTHTFPPCLASPLYSISHCIFKTVFKYSGTEQWNWNVSLTYSKTEKLRHVNQYCRKASIHGLVFQNGALVELLITSCKTFPNFLLRKKRQH